MSAVILVAVSYDCGQMRRDEPQNGHQPTGELCWKTSQDLPPSCGSSRSAAGSVIRSVRRHHSVTRVDSPDVGWGGRGQSSIRPVRNARLTTLQKIPDSFSVSVGSS